MGTALDVLHHFRRIPRLPSLNSLLRRRYLAVAGLNQLHDPNPAKTLLLFAIEVLRTVTQKPLPNGQSIRVRMGLSIGPVAAGVLGKFRRKYTIMGDAVNLAVRLEALGEPMQIHLTRKCADAIGLPLDSLTRRTVTAKGLGELETFLLDPETSSSLLQAL